jgi:serine O-acetyltransferase
MTMSKIVIFIHRIIFTLHTLKIPILPKIINKIFIRLLFGCQIGEGTNLGNNVELGYGGLGIVIHERAVVGNRVSISPGVTIGGTSRKHGVPHIKDNCIIYAGAKILGPITIGQGSVIGANAVVLESIPDRCLAVGIPAKIIKSGINVADYRD